MEAALAGAARGLIWLRGHEEEARLCVADAYLDTFNQTWTEEGPITREEFEASIYEALSSRAKRGTAHSK